jgi:pimeloyl-ACP methyl ester carboxylesterase
LERFVLSRLCIVSTQTIQIRIGGQSLTGELTIPPAAIGLVLFAHGSGSSRFSPRNHFVARALEGRRLATLLIDLLTPDEERTDRETGHLRFDIALLADRLALIIDTLETRPDTAPLRVALFGASTGGGAAIVAAAIRPARVVAVVSRGGRPDLAGDALSDLTAPTLLIVGTLDTQVLALNREAMQRMRGDVQLELVPGATHLFEEPGTLGRVADLAADFLANAPWRVATPVATSLQR